MVGDRVVITNAEFNTRKYVGQIGKVIDTKYKNYSGDPFCFKIHLELGPEIEVFSQNICPIPPKDSPFQYGDAVKVTKDFGSTAHHICKFRLIGKDGVITSYDKRDKTYLVYNSIELEEGWFPANSLLPTDYRGETFYLPNDRIWYQDRICTISKIKKTKFNWGQILLINGEWVPSTDVAPLRDGPSITP